MPKPFLSVIIPAYNESKRLPLTLIDIDKHLDEQEYSYEIVVVDNGSVDDTAEIVRRFIPLINNLRLVEGGENKGKGAAVKLGMLEAKGVWRLFLDADNSTSVVEFNKMIPYFKSGYDVVIGSRAVRGAKSVPNQPLYKRILGKMGNLIIQLFLLPGIKDTQCGFKCFSEDSAKIIFPLIKIERWGFDAEVLALAKKLGFKIKEIPVFWVNDIRSQVKLSDYFQVLLETVKIRWWLWWNAYSL